MLLKYVTKNLLLQTLYTVQSKIRTFGICKRLIIERCSKTVFAICFTVFFNGFKKIYSNVSAGWKLKYFPLKSLFAVKIN